MAGGTQLGTIELQSSDTSNDGTKAFITAHTESASARTSLVFGTATSGQVNAQARMTINSDGNVGIGTSDNLSNTLGTLVNINNASIIGNGTSGSYFGYNVRYDGAWERNETSAVGILSFTNSGNLSYRTAASGNAGTEPSLTEIIRTGDASSPAYVTFDGASQVRLTLGSEGSPGTNTANWIRGNAANLQFNSAGGFHSWEVSGSERLKLGAGGDITGTMINATSSEYIGDVDDLKKTGFYRSNNGNANNPTSQYYSIIVFGNQGNVTSQIAVTLAATTTYVRSFNNSWTSWARLDT